MVVGTHGMNAQIPFFNEDGVLPPGDYPLTISDLRLSHLVTGESNPSKTWDKIWRLSLVDNLEIMHTQLSQVGIDKVFVDGSFVENKDHPHDIDGYFECDLRDLASGLLERELNLIDPFKCWTWDPSSRRRHNNFPNLQLPMWHRYRVELYPHYGQSCGIKDQFGNDQVFPAAFRKTRALSRRKGILQIIS